MTNTITFDYIVVNFQKKVFMWLGKFGENQTYIYIYIYIYIYKYIDIQIDR